MPSDNLNNENNEHSETIFNREDIVGTWKITHAKYDEGATMTEWEFDDTYATFKANGRYIGRGYWGNGEGTYSIEHNTITTYVNSLPYILYEVISLNNDIAEIKAMVSSTSQNVWIRCIKVSETDNETDEDSNSDHEINSPAITDKYQITENLALLAMGECYNKLKTFEAYRREIEYRAINNYRSELMIQSDLIWDAWSAGYTTINYCSNILSALNKSDEPWATSSSCHFQCIRAFVYYNLVTIWGAVPYWGNESQISNPAIKRTDINTIINGERVQIEEAMINMDGSAIADNITFNKESAQMLLAEIELYQNHKETAKSILESIDKNKFSNGVIFNIKLNETGSENSIIYSTSTIDLYMDEVNDNKEGLLERWTTETQYGCWQSLKRLGKAMEMTGCQEYELLMPIPAGAFVSNPYLEQNPGYKLEEEEF